MRLGPGDVQRWLLWCIGAIVVTSTVTRLVYLWAPSFPLRDGISYTLWVDSEQSVPTMFSVALLASCALALAVSTVIVRRTGLPDVGRWIGLTVIFVALTFDENLSLHEELIEPVRSALSTGGALHFAWVMPAGVAVLVVGACYVPFILRLPPDIARTTVLAAALYLGGALGFEMLGGWIAEDDGVDTLGYVLVATIEESLEMLGAALFLTGLVRHLRDHLGGGQLRLQVPAR